MQGSVNRTRERSCARHPLSMSPTRWMVTAVLSASVGCSGPPTSLPQDAPAADAGFEWSMAFSGLDEAILSACGRGDDLLAVGGRNDQAIVLQWTGAAWQVQDPIAGARVLWWCTVTDSGTAWAVGEGGTILRRDSGQWQLVDTFGAVSDQATLYGVWAPSDSAVFVVGGSLQNEQLPTAIARHDGRAWTPVDTTSLPAQPLFKVWGTSETDVWAVGAAGTALHYDGTAWTATQTNSEARLTAVWGTTSTDVYAVGGLGLGVVLHYDGNAWSNFANASEELAGVWTAPGQPLYVGGNRGLLIRYGLDATGRASADRATRVTPVNDRDVHSMHGVDDVVLAAASDLLGGAVNGWQGSVFTHGNRSIVGPVVRPDPPLDAGVPDAGLDAGVDAGPTGPGPGEACGEIPNVCDQTLECWFIQLDGVYMCTQPCTDVSECDDYGPGACCIQPGFQTLETVCLPAGYTACSSS